MRLAHAVRSGLSAPGMAELEQSLQRYATSLADDLGLAGIEVVDGGVSASGVPLEVTINGTRCRIPMQTTVAPSAIELQRQIARVVHANRELLVDSHVAQAIYETWAGEMSAPDVPTFSREDLADFLRMLLRSCRRLSKPNLPYDAKSSGPKAVQIAFEEAVRALQGLRYVVWHAPKVQLINEVDDVSIEETFERQQKDLFNELGVRFPRVELREDPAL